LAVPPLDLRDVSNAVARSALEAMNNRDKKRWYGLFSEKPELTDDGKFHLEGGKITRLAVGQADHWPHVRS
jgi:hypothetical protein